MRYARKLLLQVAEDVNAQQKDFFTEDSLEPMIADGFTAFTSQRFVAGGSQVPVELNFGNVGAVASLYVVTDKACTLRINGGFGATGGYDVKLTPTAPGNRAEHMSDDDSIESASVVSAAGVTTVGRFIVVGSAEVSP